MVYLGVALWHGALWMVPNAVGVCVCVTMYIYIYMCI